MQFARYIGDVARGDLGISLYTQRPISEDLLDARAGDAGADHCHHRCSPSLIGVPLGVLAAVRRNSLLDHALRIFTVSGLAIASFWLAILLQLLFAMKLGVTPLQGRVDGWGPDPVTGFFLIDALLQRDWE